jgi:uncharacterized protein YjbI with pentapeptide repeats
VSVRLEEEVRAFLDAGTRGVIALLGSEGMGKTTALRHLAAVLPAQSHLRLLDEPKVIWGLASPAEHLVVYAATAPCVPTHLATYSMARWDRDDLIEYLLAVHRQHCASVMDRLRTTADRQLLAGIPELWRIVLDQMAADESLPGPRAALLRFLQTELATPNQWQLARTHCLAYLIDPSLDVAESPAGEQLRKEGCPPEVGRVLRHQAVRVLLAAQQIAADLRGAARCKYLVGRPPHDLVQETAALIASDDSALKRLRHLLAHESPKLHPMSASILHAANIGWRPEAGQPSKLAGAYLAGASWPDIELVGADLCEADLSHAILSGARLDNASLLKADLSHVRLRGASLKLIKGAEVNLTQADLSFAQGEKAELVSACLEDANLERTSLPSADFRGANLKGARLVAGDLTRAILGGARIEDSDFSDANLEEANLSGLRLRQATFEGARFGRANLSRCDLEGMVLPSVDFEKANLENALLTGSAMPGASFRQANLRGAGLAEVDWENVDLREADLTGATFHMGSSRSGLVMSFIASEGSRTGFYTDDYNEQDFKAPEEIRKANLCGADLRGAKLLDVDFYLVDLRGARYDAEQWHHFQRCGAILEDRGR